MKMFKVNYPDSLLTLQQFDIFMDYVIHGLIDDCNFPVEFHGVKTHDGDVVGEVVVDVPLRVSEEDVCGVRILHDHIQAVLNCLIGNRVALTVSKVRVNLLVETYAVPQKIYIGAKLKEREETGMYIPEVKEIVHRESKRGEFFTVVWKDNTQTTVKLMEGETSDEYTAFLYALGKKMFGNKGEARKFVKEKKQVFEDRMAKKSAEKARQRKLQAIQQSLDAEDLEDISDEVYCAGFVAPCMVSKAMFRRNRQ